MDYRDYQNTRDMVWKLFIDLNITSLPISMGDVCKKLRIPIKLYTPKDDNDGYSNMTLNGPVIFVSNRAGIPRQRFTAGHELGHVLSGHTGKFQLVNREPSPTDNPIEHIANIFASRLLAPACVLWGCNVRNAEDIQKICNISLQSATFRMERIKLLYERNAFLISPLERVVFEQFSDYIKTHKL